MSDISGKIQSNEIKGIVNNNMESLYLRLDTSNGPSTGSYQHEGLFQLLNGVIINEFSDDGALVGDSDLAVPTEKAVKTYVDNQVPGSDTEIIFNSAGVFGSDSNFLWDGNGMILLKDGTVGPIFGVPSHYIELRAEGYNYPGGPAFNTTARIVNYQPIGSTEDVGNISYFLGDGVTETLRFVTTIDGHLFVPDLFTGIQDTFTFGASGTGTGPGCIIKFAGGPSFGGNGDGGPIIINGGVPNGTGEHGWVYIGEGEAGIDYRLIFDGETNDGEIRWMEDEDYFDFKDTIKVSNGIKSSDGSDGWTGTFNNADGDTVTVKDGIITDVS